MSNLYTYNLLVERILSEHNRYYFKRKYQMELSMALEKANNLQKILNNKIQEEIDHDEVCAICYDSMKNKSTVRTSCNHTFCLNCVTMNKECNVNTGSLCTICRNDIFN